MAFDWSSVENFNGMTAGLLLITTVVLYKAVNNKKENKLPPGPAPWPLVGNIPSLGMTDMHLQFGPLRKKYGDVFTVYLGPNPMVILNTPKVTREAFLQKANDYAGRPDMYSFKLFTDGGKDIVLSQPGPIWKLQRKIAHSAMRKYATGQHLEDLVSRAFNCFETAVLKEPGQIDPMDYVFLLIFNVISGMCFGEVLNPDDPVFLEQKKVFRESNEQLGGGLLADFIPLLRLKIFETTKVKQIRSMATFFQNFLGSQFDKHVETYDPDNCTNLTYDLIHFWKKAQKEEEDKTALSQLDKPYFIQILSDVFFAGIDTSRLSLTYLIGHMVNHPECQQKVHDEIDQVVGGDGLIELSSKERLPYTSACLFESMRLMPAVPLALPHTTTCDTTLGEYSLPKGTGVMMNTWAIHHDPDNFPDPWTYKPERWLDESGQFQTHPYNFVSFSMGRRVCVGESVAKAELPLLAAKIFQKLKFESPTGSPIDLKGTDMFGILEPSPFQVKVLKRA